MSDEPRGPDCALAAALAGGDHGLRPVTEREWHRWRRRSLAAWAALGLATTGAFYAHSRERAARIEQAAIVIRVRCKDSRQNRAAIRVLLVVESRERGEHPPAARRRLRAALAALPAVQNCEQQVESIRGLVD